MKKRNPKKPLIYKFGQKNLPKHDDRALVSISRKKGRKDEMGQERPCKTFRVRINATGYEYMGKPEKIAVIFYTDIPGTIWFDTSKKIEPLKKKLTHLQERGVCLSVNTGMDISGKYIIKKHPDNEFYLTKIL